MFKFVISSESDALEVLNEFAVYIDMNKVVFMPAGENQEQLDKTRPIVA